MKKNKPKDTRSIEKFVFLNYFVILLTSIGFMVTLCFLYQNIYKTIDTTKNHVLVKINPDFKPIDFRLYEETLKNWEEKIKKDSVSIKKDPFYGTTVTSTEKISTSTEEILLENTENLNNVEISI